MKNFLTIFSDDRSSLLIQQSPNLCMCIRAFTLLSDPWSRNTPGQGNNIAFTGRKGYGARMRVSTDFVKNVSETDASVQGARAL